MRFLRKSAAFYIPWVFLLCLLGQCVREDIQVPALPVWKSHEPLDIPYRIREAQYQKGNLVRNPSFEDGRLYDLDSLNTRFNITGWKKSGDHVYWVDADADSLYEPSEVYSGRHAIRIRRQKADETSGQGDGMISEFIRVIPGNYELSYNIRLENIFPNKGRRGTRIFDAVDIRVLYYDKNKLMIDGGSYYPYEDIVLDNTFKAFQYSNYWYIDSLGWSMVRGRTCNFPYRDGDIPDEARYVRIFLGLKGTGTMWVDSVEYRYTKRNFSFAERMMPLLDTSHAYTDLVVPTPRYMDPGQPMVYHSTDHDTVPFPIISIPAHADLTTRNAARMLRDRILTILNAQLPDSVRREVRIVTGMSLMDIESGRLIFSLGRNAYFNKMAPAGLLDTIAGIEQAYVISPLANHPNLVFLAGNDPAGSYYAAATACQLLESNSCIYHNATVVDYPAFLQRSFRLGGWQHELDVQSDLKSLTVLSGWKLNRACIGYTLRDGKRDWYKPGELYRSGVRKVASGCSDLGVIRPVQMINPYYHFTPGRPVDSLTPEEKTAWTHSSQRSVRQLLEVMKIGGSSGIRDFILCTNDYLPLKGSCGKNYSLYDQNDIKRFVNLQNAHAYLIRRITDWMHSSYGKVHLDFVPPWYNNEFIDESCGEGEQYLKDLSSQLPTGVDLAWAGGGLATLTVDEVDIKRFTGLTHRMPFYWDNSLAMRSQTFDQRTYPLYYPGKVRLQSLFEPFELDLPGDFQSELADRKLFVNLEASSVLSMLKLATAADYMWNPSAYDPDLSIWKILVSTYGTETTRHIVDFNDAYYHLESICLRMEQNGVSNRLIRNGEDMIAVMNRHVNFITSETERNQDLAIELHILKNRMIIRFRKLQSRIREVIIPKLDSLDLPRSSQPRHKQSIGK